MSNRRRLKPQDPATAILSALDGACIPGGCEYCEAEQAVTANMEGHGGIHLIRVLHDPDCPWLAARSARR